MQPPVPQSSQSSFSKDLDDSVGLPAAHAPAGKRLPWSRGEKIFVLGASMLFLALCIGSIRTEAVTANETVHIPAGLSYLQRFDVRMNIQHPPLIKMLAAFPLLLMHASPITAIPRGMLSAPV